VVRCGEVRWWLCAVSFLLRERTRFEVVFPAVRIGVRSTSGVLSLYWFQFEFGAGFVERGSEGVVFIRYF